MLGKIRFFYILAKSLVKTKRASFFSFLSVQKYIQFISQILDINPNKRLI